MAPKENEIPVGREKLKEPEYNYPNFTFTLKYGIIGGLLGPNGLQLFN